MEVKTRKLEVQIEDIAATIESWTVAEEKSVRRSLDFRIVPIVFVLYLLCFLDRYECPTQSTRMP